LHVPVLNRVAERFPDLPILCHHMARMLSRPGAKSGIAVVTALARHPNVFVKISGFGYAAPPDAQYPYDETGWMVRALYEFFGAQRLCWGSDYPVVRRYMTYKQALDVVRRHSAFMTQADQDQVFGGTIGRLLARRT
jgi:predicted TIM-barrel fold metal-dependent hydrolase